MTLLVPIDWTAAERLWPVERLDAAVGSVSDLELVLWLVVCTTLVLDVALTAYGLSNGFVERNPVMREALDSLGLAALFIAKFAALGIAVGFRLAWPEYSLVAPLGLAVPWTLAAAYNAVLLASL
jgi:hypothetical protein